MKKRNWLFFLQDIQNSIGKILRYTENITFDEFENDEKTFDAIVRNFEIIGEAVKNLPDRLKLENPEIPFKQVAGMRDKLIHDYFGVDYEIVFKTIKDKMPEFKNQIDNIIKKYEN